LKDKVSFNEVAKKPVRMITIIYAAVKMLSYMMIASPYTLHRVGVGIIMVCLVFALTGSKKLTQRQLAVLVPMSLVAVELSFVTYMGGDRLTYYFLMGVPLLSLFYMDIKGIFGVMLLIAVITAAMVFGFGIHFMRYSSAENEFFSFLGMIILYALFFLLSRYSITELISARRSAEKQAQVLAEYTKTLEADYNEMRKFRHDHLSLLHGFAGFIGDDNQEGIKEYLRENLAIAEKSLKALDKNVEDLQTINIPELKGLLAVKFAGAQSEGIEVRIDIAQPVEDIPLERTDLCRIAGIMVDNAVEELLYSGKNYERKLIEFGIILSDSDVLIVCTNNCKDTPPIEEIFKENYSTKGSGRGLGLYNLKQICKKAGNAWVSAHTQDRDTFTVAITVAL